MTDSPVFPPSTRTFDLAAVLQGRSFPEVEVPFYIDEESALKLARREKLITRLELLQKNEEAQAMAQEVAALREAIKASRYVYHLRGISNKTRQDLLEKASEKYPRERDFLGSPIESDQRDGLFTDLLWHAMTTHIVAPDGSVQSNLTFEQIQQIRQNLPMVAIQAIQEGVTELTVGARAGFESAVQDGDFLSQP